MNVTCPHCTRELAASEDYRGLEVECPLCKKQFVVPTVDVVVRHTNGQSSAPGDCPYCRSSITSSDDVMPCPECGTPHHNDCWEENNGCSIYGCAQAPPDEDKIVIPEVSAPVSKVSATHDVVVIDADVNTSKAESQARPWVRYWARYLDMSLFFIILVIVLATLFPALLDMNDLLFNILGTFAYVFIEAGLLASWGTTPGKSLLRVKLTTLNGTQPTYDEALTRSFKVWSSGIGCGIPIIGFFTQLVAYDKLNKEGITSWDKSCNFKVSHSTIGMMRCLVSFAIIFFALMLIFGAYAQQS